MDGEESVSEEGDDTQWEDTKARLDRLHKRLSEEREGRRVPPPPVRDMPRAEVKGILLKDSPARPTRKEVETNKVILDRVQSGFVFEPLRRRVLEILRMKDELLARALEQDITQDFIDYLTESIDRNENIILSCAGRTRSGKSYAMLELALIISSSTGIPFTVERNICWHNSQLMTRVREAQFKEFFVVDETEESAYGMGSSSEAAYILDFNRICAKKCINRVHVIGDYSSANDKALYKLITLARDFKNRVTKLLVYSIEAGENLPIGYIDIPLRRILCTRMKEGEVSSCIRCDAYGSCPEFMAQYERYKDTNIARITEGGEGGSADYRQNERDKVAVGIAINPLFATCGKSALRLAFVRREYHEFTNRTLTEGEVKEVAEMAGWLLDNPDYLMASLERFPSVKEEYDKMHPKIKVKKGTEREDEPVQTRIDVTVPVPDGKKRRGRPSKGHKIIRADDGSQESA